MKILRAKEKNCVYKSLLAFMFLSITLLCLIDAREATFGWKLFAKISNSIHFQRQFACIFNI